MQMSDLAAEYTDKVVRVLRYNKMGLSVSKTGICELKKGREKIIAAIGKLNERVKLRSMPSFH